MLTNFVKYNSLGNDFVIFDWYKKPVLYMRNELNAPSFAQFIICTCDRHRGIGADGVIFITNCAQESIPEMIIFNADGSMAETCLNGLRCVAHHLLVNHNFPKQFKIKTGQRTVECVLASQPKELAIVTRVGAVQVEPACSIETAVGSFTGHPVSVGNPHFIIFDSTTVEWLRVNGATIESHSRFPNRTNVEFVTPIPEAQNKTGLAKAFTILVYERGVGVTLACSSGAAAIAGLLRSLGQIEHNQKVALCMQGGMVVAWVEKDNTVVLQATAQCVFKGSFIDQQAESLSQLHHSQAV